ncbi:MAG: HupE/UreJ family protein [Pseudomonadota bacterium]
MSGPFAMSAFPIVGSNFNGMKTMATRAAASGKHKRPVVGVLRTIATLVLLGIYALIAMVPAHAHEQRPTIVTLTFEEGGRYTITFDTNIEAWLAQIGPEHDNTQESPKAGEYNALRALPPSALRERFNAFADQWLKDVGLVFNTTLAEPRLDGVDIPEVGDTDLARASIIRVSGRAPQGAQNFIWAFPEKYGSSALRIERPGKDLQAQFFMAGAQSRPLPIGVVTTRSNLETFWDYVVVGFTHILPKGLDHILFVLGLFFLSMQLRPLLWQVTAFTVAHSVTLALGLYGIINLSPAIVEPLIALSIVYVAVENIFVGKLTTWRPAIVFAFGLLHGLGFAGILTEIGLPPSQYALGLIAFNVGVEFGQLTVIIGAFLFLGWFADKAWYRARVAIPASLAIAAFGAWWFVERTFL